MRRCYARRRKGRVVLFGVGAARVDRHRVGAADGCGAQAGVGDLRLAIRNGGGDAVSTKLWCVDVTTTLMIAASSQSEAEEIALEVYVEENDVTANAVEVRSRADVPTAKLDSVPCGDGMGLDTCAEMVERIEAAQFVAEHQLPLPGFGE